MRCINVVGALVRLKGITIHSKRENLILKVVFQISFIWPCVPNGSFLEGPT
jgi:hypothetical protein